MTWVCPICSTNNEDTQNSCIVCGESRTVKGLGFDIQSQMKDVSSSFDSLLNAYKPFNVEEAFKAAEELIQSNSSDGFAKMFECARRGYPPAENEVGECYYYGIGVAQDFSKAMFWFEKAAQQSFAVAQYNLASCYYYGNGTYKNLTTAVYWYKKAAEQGYDQAIKALEKIKSDRGE